MERHGFIHDMLDVKLLILFVAKHCAYPIDGQTIYELCFQDETLSYFDVKTALPQMVESGHLRIDAEELYTITEKGRDHESVMEDLIAVPVRERAKAAVDEYNRERRRDEMIHIEITPQPDGEFNVAMQLDYERGRLMRLELGAPTEKQARALRDAFHDNAEVVYQNVLTELLGLAGKNQSGEKKQDGKN